MTPFGPPGPPGPPSTTNPRRAIGPIGAPGPSMAIGAIGAIGVGGPRGARPALVLAAHGTRSVAGERTLAALADAARRARPGHRVELGFLEISSPLVADVLPAVPGPVVVVPLLLAGGYHAHIDLPEVIAGCRPDALVAGWLGPHRLLTSALARKLAGAGLRPGDAVVLGAAGSSDPAALADVRAAAHRLSVRLSRPVTAAFASAGEPTLPQALDQARRTLAPPGATKRARETPALTTATEQAREAPALTTATEHAWETPALPEVMRSARARPDARVAIASYVLAPGFFHDRLRDAGADLVTDPLGADPDVAALIWRRYDRALALREGQAAWTGSSRSSRTISSAPASRVGPASAPTNISM